MKNPAKTIFILTGIATALFICNSLGFSQKALGVTSYIEGSRCPQPPDPALASICGYVKSAVPLEEIQPDGSKILVERKGLEGVSVYLYECDNKYASCKNNGNIVNAFSSTSTDVDGKFHLTMRKVDGLITLKNGDEEIPNASVPSKRRYLIFVCGSKFAGLQIVPSFVDMTEITQEAKCPELSVYREPPIPYKLVGNTNAQLASHMGSDETNFSSEGTMKKPGEQGYIPILTTQAYFKETPAYQNLNMDLKLENNDPRFIQINDSDYIDKTNNWIGGLFETKIKRPDLGAYWELDCIHKYSQSDYFRKNFLPYCMNPDDSKVPNDGDIQERDNANRQARIDEYESRLYGEDIGLDGKPITPGSAGYKDFVIQNKLPNIPPKKDILFYKELPARQDITEYITDPTIGRFNASIFSNCIGGVFLRLDGKTKDDKYAPCSLFQECNETINNNNYINSLTTSGVARNLASPDTFKDKFDQDVDRDIVVCQIDEAPVKIREIQPPWDLDSSKYKLDKSYWNSEYMYSFSSQNNRAGVRTTVFENNNDSRYANPAAISEEPFKTQKEALGDSGLGDKTIPPGVVQQSGTGMVYTNSKKTPNNSLAESVEFTQDPNNKDTPSTKNSLANLFSPPNKDNLYEKDVTTGIFVGTVGSGLYKLGEYSNTNIGRGIGPETVIVNPEQDNSILTNIKNRGNPDHYPFQDFYTGGLYSICNIIGICGDLPSQLKQDGTRTPTSAMYMTSPAIKRHDLLKNKLFECPACDFYDSFLSMFYGDGKLIFGGALMDNAFNVLKIRSTIDKILSFLGIMGPVNDKSFFDRKAAESLGVPGAIDSLTTHFLISEENFLEEFKLPILGELNYLGNPTYLFPEDWKGTTSDAKQCYPWIKIGVGGKCDTYPDESVDKISRTCRVDKCYTTTTELECTCTRAGIWGGYSYSVHCPNHSSCTNLSANVQISETECDPRIRKDDLKYRKICAQKQYTCIDGELDDSGNLTGRDTTTEKTCIKEVAYCGDIKGGYEAMELNNELNYCGPDQFKGLKWPDVPSVRISQPLLTPSCIVSRAGPYTCAGVLKQDSELEAKSQVLNENYPKVAVDTVRVASNEMSQLFSTPTCTKLVYSPSAFSTATSSVRDTRYSDISKRVDTLITPGGDSQTPSILRSTFGSPATSISSQFNAINYHCNNPQLGGSGKWNCEPNPVPNPEYVNIEKLATKPGCKLNPSPQCNELVFGPGYNGGETQDIPACLKQYYPNFPQPSKSGNFSDVFVKVISAAASKYDIPASVLLAYMSGINKIAPYRYFFSKAGEIDFFNASAPWYGSISDPICDDMGPGPQGPFDWRLYWFNSVLVGMNGAKDSRSKLNELSKNRGNTASRCNFLDAAYTAAAAIAQFNTGCSKPWESYIKALEALTFGTDPKGVLKSNPTYKNGGLQKNIFEACR